MRMPRSGWKSSTAARERPSRGLQPLPQVFFTRDGAAPNAPASFFARVDAAPNARGMPAALRHTRSAAALGSRHETRKRGQVRFTQHAHWRSDQYQARDGRAVQLRRLPRGRELCWFTRSRERCWGSIDAMVTASSSERTIRHVVIPSSSASSTSRGYATAVFAPYGDDHTTLVASLITKHGRATPLLWNTVKKSTLAGHRNQHEDELLEHLRDSMPEGVTVTILADRGFGDQQRSSVERLRGCGRPGAI